jgi:putative NADH-flavin reductase
MVNQATRLQDAQNLTMLAHEIFDPETNKRVLVDHAFIVAGGEITKAARNWIGNALDASKRSQIMFIDLDDILSLYVVTNLPLPPGALPAAPLAPWAGSSGEPPF